MRAVSSSCLISCLIGCATLPGLVQVKEQLEARITQLEADNVKLKSLMQVTNQELSQTQANVISQSSEISKIKKQSLQLTQNSGARETELQIELDKATETNTHLRSLLEQGNKDVKDLQVAATVIVALSLALTVLSLCCNCGSDCACILTGCHRGR